MPAIYTHYIVARETWKSFPPALTEELSAQLPLYFFGAYGPDFCFFYKCLRRKRNFGSFLHQKGSFSAFQVLRAFAGSSPALLAYSLGYVTHYAADVEFHPHVYAATRSILEHTRLERAIDGHVKRSTDKADPYEAFFPPALSLEEKNELFLAYAAIAAKSGFPPLNKRDFFNAISLFNAYLPIPNALLKEKLTLSKEQVDGLMESSISKAGALCREFIAALRARKPIPLSAFGRSFLTGKLPE